MKSWNALMNQGAHIVMTDDRTISWYRRVTEKAGEPLGENLKRVKLLIDADRFADAISVLEPYLERFPEDGEAREWLTVARTARDTLQNDKGAVRAGSLLDYWRWRTPPGRCPD